MVDGRQVIVGHERLLRDLGIAIPLRLASQWAQWERAGQTTVLVGWDGRLHGALKSAPRGYPADHPRIALLRYKGLTAWQQWPAGPWLEGAEAKDRVVSFFRTTRPLSSWLRQHVRL